MAIENAKTLNVRIKNKYDSYENWASSSLVLEAGEIAIAYSSVDVQVDNGTAKHPFLLMKVGDGEHTFADLPWMSAKAADVLSVCKNTEDLTAFVNSVIADAGIASDDAMEALAERVTDVENELNTEKTGLKARVATAEEAITALELLVGDKTVKTQIEEYVATLKLGETYAAKAHTHTKAEITDFAHNHEMSEVNGLAAEFAKKVDKEANKSLIANSEIERLAGMSTGANKVEASATNGSIKIDGVETVVYTHPNKHAIADVDGLQAALNGKQDVIPENTYDAHGAAAQALTDAKAYTDSEMTRLVGDKKVSEAIAEAVAIEKGRAEGIESGLAGRIKAVEDDYLKATDKADLQNQINTIMNNPDTEGVINSINEFTQYITEHGEIAEGFRTDINALSDAVAAIPQADWNQNDPEAADYVKNRTHYDNSNVEYLVQNASFANMTYGNYGSGSIVHTVPQWEVGKDYYLEFNGATYKAAFVESDRLLFEQIPHPANDEINSAQLAIGVWSSNLNEINVTGAYDLNYDWKTSGHTFSIYSGTIDIKQLDEKFIPTTIARANAVEAVKADINGLAVIAKTGSTDDLVQGALTLVFDCGGAN